MIFSFPIRFIGPVHVLQCVVWTAVLILALTGAAQSSPAFGRAVQIYQSCLQAEFELREFKDYAALNPDHQCSANWYCHYRHQQLEEQLQKRAQAMPWLRLSHLSKPLQEVLRRCAAGQGREASLQFIQQNSPSVEFTQFLHQHRSFQSAHDFNRQAHAFRIRSSILEGARRGTLKEMRAERIYIVTLGMTKSQVTLDPLKHLANGLSAVRQDILVSQSTYIQWQVGTVLSSKVDKWGLAFRGAWATYKVTVKAKRPLTQYFAVDVDHTTEISLSLYQDVLQELKQMPKTTLTSYYSAGVDYHRILPRTSEVSRLKDMGPLKHYFLKVRIQNDTLTLNPGKALRDFYNAHELEIEVPETVYNNGHLFSGNLNIGSFIFKGRLTSMKGSVIGKRIEDDPVLRRRRTSDGIEIVR